MFDFGLFPDFLTDNMVARILFAAVLGALIGLERDIRGRSAGLRTNILVSVGSSVFMLLSIGIAERYAASGAIDADPTRIAAQIITGIGFLGAGAIIRDGLTIKGLTTAATLWVAASIGMSAGAGFYNLAFVITIIALIALSSAEYIDRSKRQERVLKLRFPTQIPIENIRKIIDEVDLNMLCYDYKLDNVNNTVEVQLIVTPPVIDPSGDDKGEELAKIFAENKIELLSLDWTHRYE